MIYDKNKCENKCKIIILIQHRKNYIKIGHLLYILI